MACRVTNRAAYRTRAAAGRSFSRVRRFMGDSGGISSATSAGQCGTHWTWTLTLGICLSGTQTYRDLTHSLSRSGNAYALDSKRIPHHLTTPAPLRRKNTHALIPDKSPHRPKAALVLLQRWDAHILAPTMSGAGVPVTLALLRMPDARNPRPTSRSISNMKSTTTLRMGRHTHGPSPAAPLHSS